MRRQFSQVSHGHEAIPNGEGLCSFREGDVLDKIVRLLATILVHKYDVASYVYTFFVHGSLMHLIVQTWAFPPKVAISIVVNHRPNAASFWLIFDGSADGSASRFSGADASKVGVAQWSLPHWVVGIRKPMELTGVVVSRSQAENF